MSETPVNLPAGLGELIDPLEIGPIAHGGHWVARTENRVVFVRHGLSGESVTAQVTDTSHDRYWRADVTQVRVASNDRAEPVCAIAGDCGGCDFQHVTPPAQRELKRTVLAEQLQRLAKIDWQGTVEEVPGGSTGWRTRMRYRTDSSGALGMRKHRSHQVVRLPADGCAIAARHLDGDGWPADVDVTVAGETVVVDGERIRGEATLTETAAGRTWQVAADGFWQVHPQAADTLVAAVLDGVQPRPGERALDLYCGVGLFAGALAGQQVKVQGVDSHRGTIALARRNVPTGTFRAGRVDRELPRLWPSADIVVLDPPRAGAGRRVVTAVAARNPRVISYVACDPAALSRDLAYFAEVGYRASEIRAFDLFPMTHHLEAVATLVPDRVA